MNVLLHLVFFLSLLSCHLFGADPAESVASAESTDLSYLEEYCRQGGYDLGPFISTVHMAENRKNIQKFIGKFSGGRLLILGVGPGNDVPVEWLLKRFDHITLIDGDLKPIRELIEKLAEENPFIKNKVELVQADLSGGFFKLLKIKKEDFASMVGVDYLTGNGIGTVVPSTEGFFNELVLNLAPYKPDVIISSLVASVVVSLALTVAEDPIMKLGLSLDLIGSLQPDLLPTDLSKKFPEFYGKVVAPRSKALVLNAYLKGIASAGAQLVYFADTNVHNFDKNVFEDFKSKYKNNFNIDSLDNAWSYRPGFQVSWYTFATKELCASCREQKPRNTCTGCRTAKYCNKQCQTDHWGMHKISCKKKE